MQNSPFKQKINKQHEVILRQLNKFRTLWQGKVLQIDKIQNYCNFVTYVSQLQSTYVHNCMQYFTPVMKQQTIRINKNLIEDMIKKIRHFSLPYNHIHQQPSSSFITQTCQVCQTKIRQVDIRLIKQQLADDATLRKGLLKKMYIDMQNEHAQLFTKDEDQVFFKFLNRILIKKQQVLAMQTKQINDFLVQVTKSFSDLNFLTQYTPVKLNSTYYKQNYKQQMQKSIGNSLKSGFNTKIHPWMSKVFDGLRKLLLKQKRQNYVDEYQQTGDELVDYSKKRSQYMNHSQNKRQLQGLKDEVNKSNLLIDQLKSKISVLQKQKKQLQDYYAKQTTELMMGKRKIQMQLKKTQSDFFHLQQTKKSQIIQLNKKLNKSKKKTQPNTYNQSKNINNTNQSQPNQSNSLNQSTIMQQQLLNQTNKDQNISLFGPLKKKKSNLNRLLSKKSQADKIVLNNNVNDNLDGNQSKLKQRASQIQQQGNSKLADQFLKQIKLNKKGNQKLKTKDQKQSQPHSKVQFKLNQSQQNLQKPSGTITQAYQTKNQMESTPLPQVPKIIKKKSNKNSKKSKKQPAYTRTGKRMLSIQMKIPPQMTSGQYIYKPSPLKSKKSEQQSILGSNLQGTRAQLSSRKKVFEYVPLQNQQQYEELKQKVSEITSKIELRNTERLKASVKYIKDSGDLSSGDLGKMYGHSIFSKKNSNIQNQSNRIAQESQESINSYKQKKSIYRSKSKKRSNKTHHKQPERQQYGLQTSFSLLPGPSAIDQISHTQRQAVYSNLKNEQLIPTSISYKQYEMIVRKLFSDQKEELFSGINNNSKIFKQRISSMMNNQQYDIVNKMKQKQSVKITIDAKFFQDVKIGKRIQHNSINNNGHSKVLLNLPKLTNLPNGGRGSNINMSCENSCHSTNPGSNNKSLFHTVRQKHNKIGIEENLFNLSEIKCSANIFNNNNNFSDKLNLGNKQNVNNQQVNTLVMMNNNNNHSQPNSQALVNNNMPSLIKSISGKKYNELFTNKDIGIFFESQLFAYQYQQRSKTSLHSHHLGNNAVNNHGSNNNNKSLSPSKSIIDKLGQQQYKQLSSLYILLSQIKVKNLCIYNKVLSFIKCPYQSIKNGFEFINIVKDISLQMWINNIMRIYKFVNKNNINKQNNNNGRIQDLNKFIKPLQNKLIELLILANKQII